MASQAQVRRIVSSFLTVGDIGRSSFRVALFKRSIDRPVYSGLWAACSGKIEATDSSPLAAAWREVKEETGLERPKLELTKQGKMIELEDRGIQKMWHIYPFVFKLMVDAQEPNLDRLIQLDAEHSEVKFVTLEQMRQMQTVDNLYESLLRALQEDEK